MKNDDSFKKPGSIPFKWEIRPGVPKPPLNATGSLPASRSVSEPDYYSDLEISSRWFVSSRKTVPTSSPSIHGSSPPTRFRCGMGRGDRADIVPI
ncbi:uncharacterized protein LOC121744084 [Salvia splendens]|uniref:uncharacterized protein LOC121744084 n=1 Tax=Salvia splendens TaxID=180675 RepID=UPI001C26808C|nr:uncharacterized protein LOC121744084 [Salvia splendens]